MSWTACRGLLALWRYMRTEMGINTREIWESIQELIVKTIIRCGWCQLLLLMMLLLLLFIIVLLLTRRDIIFCFLQL